MKSVRGEDKRREQRKQVIGDVLWSYARNEPVPQFDGTLVDVSKSGLNMITDRIVKEGYILRLVGKGIWPGVRFATVMWCEKISDNVFRSGLLLNK